MKMRTMRRNTSGYAKLGVQLASLGLEDLVLV